MQRSLVGPIVAFGELAGCAQTTIDGPWATDWTPWQLSLQPVRAQNSTPIYGSTCGSTVYFKHAVGCTDWQIPVLPTPNPLQKDSRLSRS